MERPFDALFLGMLNFDISVPDFSPEMLRQKQSFVPNITMGTGGDALNCAIAFRRLGGKCAIGGRIGNDLQGRAIQEALARESIHTQGLTIDPDLQTGTVVDLIDASHEACFIASYGANASFNDDDIPDYLLKSTHILSINSLLGCGALTQMILRRAHECGALTAADTTTPPPGTKLETIIPYLAHLDYFLPSLSEAQQLSGEASPAAAAAIFHHYGAKNVIIKLGGDGCYYSSANESGQSPGLHVRPVDFTGCGDNFVAAFLLALVRGCELSECAALANAAGGRAAEQLGPSAPPFALDDLRHYYLEHQKG